MASINKSCSHNDPLYHTKKQEAAKKAAATRKAKKIQAEKMERVCSLPEADAKTAFNPFTHKVYTGDIAQTLTSIFKKNNYSCNFWVTGSQAKTLQFDFKGTKGKWIKLNNSTGKGFYFVINVCELKDLDGIQLDYKCFSEKDRTIKNADVYYYGHRLSKTEREQMKSENAAHTSEDVKRIKENYNIIEVSDQNYDSALDQWKNNAVYSL
jgi:hypothetical protein